jgi:hypothetical protein
MPRENFTGIKQVLSIISAKYVCGLAGFMLARADKRLSRLLCVMLLSKVIKKFNVLHQHRLLKKGILGKLGKLNVVFIHLDILA